MTNHKVVKSSYNLKFKESDIVNIKKYCSELNYTEQCIPYEKDTQYRLTSIAYPNHLEPNLYNKVKKIIDEYINHYNDLHFNYVLDGNLDIQLLKYYPNGNYKWHCDYGSSHIEGSVRKLSLSVQFSHENEYKGGDLELINQYGQHVFLGKHYGDGIIFNSKTPHKAHLVESGIRDVLVVWATGPEFK